MLITALPQELLQQLFLRLDWMDLLSVEATCRKFREAAAPHSEAWKRCCLRRWHGSLNTDLYQAPTSDLRPSRTLWRHIFTSDNGWSDRSLSVRFLAAREHGSVSAVAALQRAEHEALVGWASSHGLFTTLIDTSTCPTKSRPVKWKGFFPPSPTPDSSTILSSGPSSTALPTSLALISDNLGKVVTGMHTGSIGVYQIESCTAGVDAVPAALLKAWTGCSSPVVHVSHLPVGGRVLALHDGLAARRRDGVLRLLDVEEGGEVLRARELFEGYELAACVAADEHGNEIVGGIGETVSRASQGMVQRYTTYHRSVFPHLELVRQHYLLTSHAGCPLALWDRRNLNGPVYEAPPLPEKQCSYDISDVFLCNDNPHHRGLRLSSSADWMVGYSDSGKLWLWDLSEKLGWADGSIPGSWLRNAILQEANVNMHLDECDYEQRPRLLAAMLHPESVQLPGHYGNDWTPTLCVALGQDWVAGIGSLPLQPCQSHLQSSYDYTPFQSQNNTVYFLQPK